MELDATDRTQVDGTVTVRALLVGGLHFLRLIVAYLVPGILSLAKILIKQLS